MRLAILGARGIPAHYGGFETFAEQLAVRLVERGHEVTVFCEAGESASQEYKGVKLRHVRARNLGPLTTVVYDAASLWQGRSRVDRIFNVGYCAACLLLLPPGWGIHLWDNLGGL